MSAQSKANGISILDTIFLGVMAATCLGMQISLVCLQKELKAGFENRIKEIKTESKDNKE